MRVRRGIGAATVAVIVVAILALAVVAYYYEGTSVQPTSTTKSSGTKSTTATTPETTTTSSTTPLTVQIVIGAGTGSEAGEESHLTFDPQNITVVIGVNNTVEWVNQDSVMHSVTGVNDTSLNDTSLNPAGTAGDTYTFTFTAPGTYPYKCIYHFWMTGTIKVVEPKA